MGITYLAAVQFTFGSAGRPAVSAGGPAGQQLGGPRGELGQALGVQAVPDGQVQPPQLLADGQLLGVYRVAVGGQDAWAILVLACGGRGQVPGQRPAAGVFEVVPEPAPVGGHEVAGAGVAVQRLPPGARATSRWAADSARRTSRGRRRAGRWRAAPGWPERPERPRRPGTR